MDYLDTQITTSNFQSVNDENMTVSIVGRPELIRKITPKEYTYTTPPFSWIGSWITKKTVKTSDDRVYQFIGSNKMRNINNLIYLEPSSNTNRVIYKIFDYQLWVNKSATLQTIEIASSNYSNVSYSFNTSQLGRINR